MTNHPTDQSEARAREVLAVVLGHHPSVTDNGYEPPVDFGQAIAAMLAFAVRPAGEVDLAWFSNQHRLSLQFYSPMFGDDDDQSEEWRVDRESGPINDREWETVGRGETAADAIAAARAALQEPTR